MARLLALCLPTQTGTATCTVGPGHLGCRGPAPSSQQRRGKVSLPVGEMGRWGRTPPAPAALPQGALSTLLGSVSRTRQGHGLPQPRVVGSCYWCQTP